MSELPKYPAFATQGAPVQANKSTNASDDYNQLFESAQPQALQCPHCKAQITTEVQAQRGTCAWLSCAGLCTAGICCLVPFFLCWLPFCIPPLLDVRHTCPNCKHQIGIYPACGVRWSRS